MPSDDRDGEDSRVRDSAEPAGSDLVATDAKFYGNMDVHENLKSRGAKPSELDDPLILIYEKKISSVSVVVKALELALKICAVKAPEFGENRKASLQDLATLTGAEVVTEELGMNMEKFEFEMLGSCKKGWWF